MLKEARRAVSGRQPGRTPPRPWAQAAAAKIPVFPLDSPTAKWRAPTGLAGLGRSSTSLCLSLSSSPLPRQIDVHRPRILSFRPLLVSCLWADPLVCGKKHIGIGRLDVGKSANSYQVVGSIRRRLVSCDSQQQHSHSIIPSYYSIILILRRSTASNTYSYSSSYSTVKDLATLDFLRPAYRASFACHQRSWS